MWKLYAGLDVGRSFGRCMVAYASDRVADCAQTSQVMRNRKYGVVGMAETLFDEANHTGWPRLLRQFTRDILRRRNRCIKEKRTECCICNAPSVFEPSRIGNQSLVLGRGAASPFDRWWPLSSFHPLATVCSTLRYLLLLHEPVHRMLSQLLVRCPATNQSTGSCAPWGVRVLRFIYSKDLVGAPAGSPSAFAHRSPR